MKIKLKPRKMIVDASKEASKTGDAFIKMEVIDPTNVHLGTLPDAPDWFTTSPDGEDVDLNDPKTYDRCRYKDWGCRELRNEIYRLVGYAKMYVEQFHLGWNPEQVARIDQMLFWFGREHRKTYGDSPEGRFWLRRFLFRFENETENMC